MILRVKRAVAVMSVAGALAVGVGVPAASAQQSGLVNVDVHNVLNNNTVQVTVPVQAAANVCGVSVAVLSQYLTSTGPMSCTAGPTQTFTVLGFTP
jgi:hypothetical protein